MKKFTYLTMAALAGTMMLSSCGGGEESNDKEDKETPVAKPTAIDEIQKLTDAVKGGDIVLGTSSGEEAEEMLGADDVEFEGYKLTKSFSDYGSGLESVRYSTFYDEVEDADALNQEAKDYLMSILGEPKSDEGTNTTWEKDGMMVEFVTYSSSGYDLTIETAADEANYGSSAEQVLNLVGMFTTDAIQLGTTTKEEIGTMLGMEVDDYYMDDKVDLDEGGKLYLNRSVSLSDGKVDNVKYSTFGDAESTDQEAVKTTLMAAYGEPVEDGSKLVFNSEGSYKVSMSTYSGSGYDLYFEKP